MHRVGKKIPCGSPTSLMVIDGFFIKRAVGSSIGQSLSAFRASSLKNVSAVGSSHSLSEAMLLLSLTLFGLVSSEHYLHLLQTLSEACCFTATITLLHNDGLYYTRRGGGLSRVFENFSSFFANKIKNKGKAREIKQLCPSFYLSR